MASTKSSDASSLSLEDKKKRKSTKTILKNSNKKSVVEKDSMDVKSATSTPRKTNRYRTNSRNSQLENNVKINNGINIHTQKNRKSLIDKLRILRHDAIEQHLFSTAAFWGDKIKNLTDDPNDIYWLAQIYFFMEQYPRVEHLLLKDDLVLKNIRCRILAVQCEIRLEKWQEALEIIEKGDKDIKEKKSIKIEKGIKLEATLCYLKGLIYSKQNQYDKAKEVLKEALQIDINCYEAFNLLISNYMLTNDEEWELIQSLKCNDTVEGELIKLLYISKIKKYKHLDDINLAIERLDKDFYLGSNSDIILSQANKYYTQSKFKECLELTTKILENDKFNLDCILLHIVCLFELEKKNDLFYLAHQLVEYYPEHEISWYSVGCYYLLINQSSEARRYFSKSSTICPTFGSAWIGFAHSFAAESEHDQAILAYSTAAKLFQGIHLPAMFIGMQHLQVANFQLAEGFLTVAYDICDSDPTLLNELGVLYFNKQEYKKAIEYFEKALDYVNSVQSRLNSWEVTICNLGHAYRKIRNYEKAKEQFEMVFSLDPSNYQAYSAMAYIYQIEGRLDEAISYYHSALVLNPNDSFCAEMLKRALEELPNVDMSKGIGFKFLTNDVKMEMELNNVDERYAPPEYELLNELGFTYLLDNCKEDEDTTNIEFNINSNYQNNNEEMKDVSMEICSYDSHNEDSNIIDGNKDDSIIKDSKDTIFDKSPVNINYFMSKDYKFPDPDVTPTVNTMASKMASVEKSSTNPFTNYGEYSIYTPTQNANNSSFLSDTSLTPTISAYKSNQQTKESSAEALAKYSMITKNLLSPSLKTADISVKGNNLMTRFNNADSIEGITPSQLKGRFGASTSFIGKDTSFTEDTSVDDRESPLFQKHLLDTETPSKQNITNLAFSSVSPNGSGKGESSVKTPTPQQFLESLVAARTNASSTEGILTKDKEKGTYIFNHSYLKDYYSFLKKNNNSGSGSSSKDGIPFSSPDVNDPNNSSSMIKLSSPLKSEIKPFSLNKDDSLSDIIITSPSNRNTIADILSGRRASLPEEITGSKTSSNDSTGKPAPSIVTSTSTSVSNIIRSLIKNRRISRGGTSDTDVLDTTKVTSPTAGSSTSDLNTSNSHSTSTTSMSRDETSSGNTDSNPTAITNSGTGSTTGGSSSSSSNNNSKTRTRPKLRQELLSSFTETYERSKKKFIEESNYSSKGKSKDIHYDTTSMTSYDRSERSNNKITEDILYNEPKRLKLNQTVTPNPFLVQKEGSSTSSAIEGTTSTTTKDIPKDSLQQSPYLLYKGRSSSTRLASDIDINSMSNVSSSSTNVAEIKPSSPFVSEVDLRRNSFSSSVDLLSSPILTKGGEGEEEIEVTPKPAKSAYQSTIYAYQQLLERQKARKAAATSSTLKPEDEDPTLSPTFEHKDILKLKISPIPKYSNPPMAFSPTAAKEGRPVIINSSPKNGMISSAEEEDHEAEYFYQKPEQEHSTDDEDIDMEMD